jgi:chromosome segregation protein
MRLKRLELSGFKTFPERTAIEFASQITSIVGPNGSGKSNIFDAIRWALGEANVRSLRSSRTEDIIFAGTDRRRPLGMVEVTLTLDNEDGGLTVPAPPDDAGAPPTPLAFAEVTVTRRAMRSAETQHFINGLPCRLRDIQSMFLGTGLGGHSYSLITQGEVERLLDATPEERRMILEEAAGLAKYKRRRHDAERRMMAAETNLLRVTDILGELDAQTAALAAQADTAEQYQASTRELRILELSLQVEEIRRGTRAQRRVREQLGEIVAKRQQVETALHALVERRVGLDQRVAAAGREWEERQGQRLSLVERRAVAESAVELINERLVGADAQRQRTEQEVSRFRAEQDSLRAEHATLVEGGRDLETREGETRADVEEVEAKLRALDAEAARGEEELDACRAAVRSVGEERARLHTEMAAAEAREAAHRGRATEVDRQIVESRGRLDTVRAEAAVAVEETGRAASGLEEVRQRRAALRAERDECVRAGEALLADERRLEVERERGLARLRFLEEARSQYRGYDAGAREILLAWRTAPERLPGLIGVLADGLAVPTDFRPAIEAALGPALSALVVTSIDDARAALALLGDEPRGPVAFVPVSIVAVPAPPPIHAAVAADPGTLGRAVDRVTATGPYPDVVRALLGDVLIVADLDAAVRSRANGYQGRIVTLAGEVLGLEGCVIAGLRLPEQRGILGRTEEVADLRSALDRVARAEDELGARRVALAEQRRVTEEAVSRAGAEEGRRSEMLAEGQRRMALIQTEADRLAGEISDLVEEEAAAVREAGSQLDLLDGLRREAAALGARLEGAEARIQQLAAGLRSDAETRRAVASRITELRVLLTEVGGRRAALCTRAAELERGIAQAADRCGRLGEELGQLQQDADRLRAEGETARARREAIEAESARLTAVMAALEAERAGLGAQQADAEAEHRHVLVKASALAEDAHRVEVREAQIEAELAGARRRLEEEFGITFDRAVSAVPESVHREETLGRIEALRGRIAALGPVNLLAIEEHRQVSERAGRLRAQMEDVTGAIAALRSLIVNLEDVIRGQFDKTYAAVNTEFAGLFVRLFDGGRAQLEMVPGIDGAEPGIDIVAQPPGKKLRSLGSLSGGERVMVALALAFAMLRVRPSPFCVFDEVEAALDEANTRKVGDILRELSARSQVIIITHNKATMEASDALFGVTMEEGGVSKLVSVRLAEPAPAGEPQPVG